MFIYTESGKRIPMCTGLVIIKRGGVKMGHLPFIVECINRFKNDKNEDNSEIVRRSKIGFDGQLTISGRKISSVSYTNYILVSYKFMDKDYIQFCKEHGGKFMLKPGCKLSNKQIQTQKPSIRKIKDVESLNIPDRQALSLPSYGDMDMPKKRTITDVAPMVLCDDDILIHDESSEIFRSLMDSKEFKESLKVINDYLHTFKIHQFKLATLSFYGARYYEDFYADDEVIIRSSIMFDNLEIKTDLVSNCINSLLMHEILKLVDKPNTTYSSKEIKDALSGYINIGNSIVPSKLIQRKLYTITSQYAKIFGQPNCC